MSTTLLQLVRYLGLFVVIGAAYSITARIIPDHRSRPAASIALGMFVVTPLLFGLLFFDYELRKRAALATLSSTAGVNPPFVEIASYAPDAYQHILEEAAELTVAGASASAVQQKIRPLIVRVVRSAYLDSTDERQIALERADLNVIRSAVSRDPTNCAMLCRCWQLPTVDRIECMEELARSAAPEVRRKRDRVTLDLIRNAKRHPHLMRQLPNMIGTDALSETFANAFLKQLESNNCCGDVPCCLQQLESFVELLNGPAEQIVAVFRRLNENSP